MGTKYIKIALAIISFVLIFSNINSQKIFFTDELLFEEAGYNMAFDTNRSLINRIMIPWLGEQAWLEKPPLYFWATAAVFKIVNLFTPLYPLTDNLLSGGIFIYPFIRRLPTALAALISLYFSYKIAHLFAPKKYKTKAGVLTVMLILSSPFYIHPAREASLDLVSAAFSFAATYLYFKLNYTKPSQKRQNKYLILVGVLLGLSFLTRSFLSLTPLGVILVLHYYYCKNIKKYFFNMQILSAAFLLTILPWHLYVFTHYPSEIIQTYWHFNIVGHSVDLLEGYDKTPWYFYFQKFSLFVPWIIPLSLFLFYAKIISKTQLTHLKIKFNHLFLLLNSLVPIFLLSYSRTRHEWYIIPSVPFIAIYFSLITIRFISRIKFTPIAKDLFFGLFTALILVGTLKPIFHKTNQASSVEASMWFAANYPNQPLYSYIFKYIPSTNLYYPVQTAILKDGQINNLEKKIYIYIDDSMYSQFEEKHKSFQQLKSFNEGRIYARL